MLRQTPSFSFRCRASAHQLFSQKTFLYFAFFWSWLFPAELFAHYWLQNKLPTCYFSKKRAQIVNNLHSKNNRIASYLPFHLPQPWQNSFRPLSLYIQYFFCPSPQTLGGTSTGGPESGPRSSGIGPNHLPLHHHLKFGFGHSRYRLCPFYGSVFQLQITARFWAKLRPYFRAKLSAQSR